MYLSVRISETGDLSTKSIQLTHMDFSFFCQ